VRDKVEKPIELSITRDTVMVKSVKTSFNDKTNIFTIKISNFNDDTESLFSAAVQEALLKKPKGLILDLRNNPGGYLESAVTVASEWIKEGPIVIEEFGDGRKIEHASRGSGRLAGMPTIVLVNQGSASASEIVAGALKDDQEAKLVGEKTFGKGSVQILRQMEDGSVVKVTTAKWLTPKGTSINEQGIEPDTKIEFSASDREQNKDPQADEAVKILLHGL
jgi:carboxyl-terminal processing protease